MTAVLEAVFGQLYLITVVALVVQNLGRRSRLGHRMNEGRSRESGDAEAAGGAAGGAESGAEAEAADD